MSGAMSEGAGRELRDALVVCSDERAPYNLTIVIICVECGAEECDANFHAVHDRIHVGDNILSNSGKKLRLCGC